LVGEEIIVPIVELPPTVPFTSQVTAVFVETVELTRLTVAVKSVSEFRATLTEVGETEMEDTLVELPLPQEHKIKTVTANNKRARVKTRFRINGPPLKSPESYRENGCEIQKRTRPWLTVRVAAITKTATSTGFARR
jgi:hypothetical protein